MACGTAKHGIAARESAERATAEYDAIADGYALNKLEPWRVDVEAHSLKQLWAEVKALDSSTVVLDLACGSGIYTRELANALQSKAGDGPRPVVIGVDISSEMVATAKRDTDAKRWPSVDIHYIVGDACCSEELLASVRRILEELHRDPDLGVSCINAAYLFNYAETREELDSFVSNCAAMLRPGGWLTALNTLPHFNDARFPNNDAMWERFGIRVTAPDATGDRLSEGDRMVYTLFNKAAAEATGKRLEPLEFSNYHMPLATMQEVCEAAGFQDQRWCALSLDPERASAYPDGHFDLLTSLETAPTGMFCARIAPVVR